MPAATPSPRADTASWRIGPLTTYADPAAMAAWLERAGAGHEIVYATGPLLGEHPAGTLAQSWEAQGAVELFQRRSARAHCFDYCARRRDGASSGARTRPAVRPAAIPAARDGKAKGVRAELSRLQRHLRSLAAQNRPCPSFAEIARLLDLPRGNRGRRRAQYLLDQLADEGRVRIDRSGASARIVILQPGSARK